MAKFTEEELIQISGATYKSISAAGAAALKIEWSIDNGLENFIDWDVDNALEKLRFKNGDNILCHATRLNDCSVISLLLREGFAVNFVKPDGFTPLRIAIEYGYAKVVQLLLTKNALVNETANDGSTPLFMAIHLGHTGVAKLLLDNNAAVDQNDAYGCTPLLAATCSGHVNMVQLLLTNNAAVDQPEPHGYRPLFVAARLGYADVVKLLLKKGADINYKCQDWAILDIVILHPDPQVTPDKQAEVTKVLITSRQPIENIRPDCADYIIDLLTRNPIIVPTTKLTDIDPDKQKEFDSVVARYYLMNHAFYQIYLSSLQMSLLLNLPEKLRRRQSPQLT